MPCVTGLFCYGVKDKHKFLLKKAKRKTFNIMTAIHFDLSSFAAVSRLLTSIFLQKSRCLYLIIAWDYTSKIIYHTEKHSLTEPLFCPHKLAVCQIKPCLWHDIWQTLRKELIAGLVTRQFCWIQIADYDRTGRRSSVGSVWLETSHIS